MRTYKPTGRAPGRPVGSGPTSGTRVGNGQFYGQGQGAASRKPAAEFAPDNDAAKDRPQPDWAAVRDRKARTELLEDKLFALALSASREPEQIAAAKALHAIYNGTPVARSVNFNADDISQLSDDAIRAELAGDGGTPASPAPGDAPPGVPPQPGGILH